MALFHDLFKSSPAHIPAPELVPAVDRDADAQALVERFGVSWRKTPVKGTWCITSPGLQFTIRELPDGQFDIAAYPYETVAEFRKAFEENIAGGNAVYFQTAENEWYSCTAIIRYMRENRLL